MFCPRTQRNDPGQGSNPDLLIRSPARQLLGHRVSRIEAFSLNTLCSIGKLTQCVFGHWDVVTCLAYSRHVGLTGGDALVVSGSRDATVLVWRWSEKLQRVAASDRAEGECYLQNRPFCGIKTNYFYYLIYWFH